MSVRPIDNAVCSRVQGGDKLLCISVGSEQNCLDDAGGGGPKNAKTLQGNEKTLLRRSGPCAVSNRVVICGVSDAEPREPVQPALDDEGESEAIAAHAASVPTRPSKEESRIAHVTTLAISILVPTLRSGQIERQTA